MTIFDPLKLGDFTLKNRIIMAPMTRSRSSAQGVPPEMAVEYYGSRADAGLILTEGTAPSASGLGYARSPGIYSPEQITAWKPIAAAVHARGGRIFLQIMHVGRIATSANRTIAEPPVAPSAIRAAGEMWTDAKGMQPHDNPRALETSEIPAVIEAFAQTARNALAAGFDGVELHSASGYLPNQFLSTGANQRTDRYGGSIENRIRFVVETLEAMIAAAGSPGKVGMKVSPGMKFNDLQHEDPLPTYVALAKAIAPLGMAHLHVLRTGIGAEKTMREVYKGTLLVGGAFLKDEANKMIAEGGADAIVFGKPFLANPDLVKRFQTDAALNAPDVATFYSGGPKGYIDYPVLG